MRVTQTENRNISTLSDSKNGGGRNSEITSNRMRVAGLLKYSTMSGGMKVEDFKQKISDHISTVETQRQTLTSKFMNTDPMMDPSMIDSPHPQLAEPMITIKHTQRCITAKNGST